MLRDLTVRDLRPEIMDDPDLSPQRHATALAGLARVNVLSHTAGLIWRPIAKMAARQGLRELSLLDIASGGGDVGMELIRHARAAGIRLRYTGCDISETAVAYARQRAESQGIEAEFTVHDIFAEPLAGPFDVVVCSLFLHHLDESAAVELLRRMRDTARRLVVVSDLRRSRLGYALAHLICRIVTRSEVVRYDGPQSVAAAFRLDEVRRLAERAGLGGSHLHNIWPFRFLLTWEPSP